MKRADKTLTKLYGDFVDKRSEQGQTSRTGVERENRRHIARLAARGVTTNPELIAALPELSPKLKDFGIWWLSATNARSAEGVLLRMLHDQPAFRLSCACALASIDGPRSSSVGGSRSVREFLRIGRAELASPSPDRKWLEAVIRGLNYGPAPEAEELLLTIYERTDLPGLLRGDAGDALGCCSQLRDRRTNFFRRAWATALNGLDDTDIEVQFWSMYVITQLAQNFSSNRNRSNACFAVALPRLREIAANDHRLAPGFWWPMSAEAEDAIHVIEHGEWSETDAGDRWIGNTERGPMVRE